MKIIAFLGGLLYYFENPSLGRPSKLLLILLKHTASLIYPDEVALYKKMSVWLLQWACCVQTTVQYICHLININKLRYLLIKTRFTPPPFKEYCH